MSTTRRVILLHGLWMRPASMALLATRLSRAGFAPEGVGYASVRGGPAQAIPALVRAIGERPCHVVAHSLGGLVALTALEAHADLPVQRVVCLGSPLCGSAAASGIAGLRWAAPTLGRSTALLRDGCRPWRGRAHVGLIAGDRPMGLGRVLARFEGANDGTVAVAETRLDGLADHLVLPATHTGLVLSPQVARQAIAFLREARFKR